MKVAYGFLLLALIFLGCFGYQFFVITQLQSQVTLLRDWNDLATRSNVIVLAYSWTTEPYNSSMNAISVNCTLLNASPSFADEVGVIINAQFGTGYVYNIGLVVEKNGLDPWQTKNEYNLIMVYNTTLGYLNTVWLEPTWTR
jgi:hypothetical protein